MWCNSKVTEPFLTTLQQFIEKSSSVTSVEELYKILEETLVQECGYDRVIFSLMSDHKSLGLGAGHGVMRNYPDGWMKHYIENGFEHIDPVRRFGFRHVGPFIWDSLPLVMDLTATQKQCLNMGREAGLHNGAALCLRGVTGEVAGIGGASSSNQGKMTDLAMKQRLSMLNVISHQFYVVFCTLHDRKSHLNREEIELTQRELQVMRLMAAAKSDSVISDILKISTSAVHFHASNILRKFDTSHRITMVMKAIQSGVLSPDEAVFVRES